MVDRRARDILTARYWSPSGWKPEGERITSPDDFAYAKSKGLMFDDTGPLAHDDVVAWVLRAVQGVTLSQVAGAFLASLGTRRLDIRSALGTWVVGRWISTHAVTAHFSRGRCSTCGYYDRSSMDLNIMSFERHKWGGVRHCDVEYIAFDLTEFAKQALPLPTSEDRSLLRRILEAASTTRPDGTQADLKKQVAKVLKSNDAERDVVLKILGYCGVLENPDHRGFAHAGMTATERELARRPAGGRSDVDYPLDWWRGCHGVNEANTRLFFGSFL